MRIFRLACPHRRPDQIAIVETCFGATSVHRPLRCDTFGCPGLERACHVCAARLPSRPA
jgi:hypothetical protein